MNTTKRLFAAMMLLITTCLAALADDIKGIVVDKQTGEALIGATVMVGEKGCATDINGLFEIKGLKKGSHTIISKSYSITKCYRCNISIISKYTRGIVWRIF